WCHVQPQTNIQIGPPSGGRSESPLIAGHGVVPLDPKRGRPGTVEHFVQRLGIIEGARPSHDVSMMKKVWRTVVNAEMHHHLAGDEPGKRSRPADPAVARLRLQVLVRSAMFLRRRTPP